MFPPNTHPWFCIAHGIKAGVFCGFQHLGDLASACPALLISCTLALWKFLWFSLSVWDVPSITGCTRHFCLPPRSQATAKCPGQAFWHSLHGPVAPLTLKLLITARIPAAAALVNTSPSYLWHSLAGHLSAQFYRGHLRRHLMISSWQALSIHSRCIGQHYSSAYGWVQCKKWIPYYWLRNLEQENLLKHLSHRSSSRQWWL